MFVALILEQTCRNQKPHFHLLLGLTHCLARANNSTNIRVILARRCTLDVREKNIGNCQLRRILIAQSEILLSIALGHLNGVVDVVDGHGVIGNVLHTARATSALEVGRQGGGNAWPDLDASAVLEFVSIEVNIEHTSCLTIFALTDALNMEML